MAASPTTRTHDTDRQRRDLATYFFVFAKPVPSRYPKRPGNGKYGQAVKFRTNREINPSKKAVIFYLPNKDVPPGLIAEFTRGKFVVARSIEQLKAALRALGEKA